jgi:uracil-DNA glycosylase
LLKGRDANCTRCKLHSTAEYVCLLGAGDRTAEVMIVGEAPGHREDDSGVPFVGKAGKLLNRLLEDINLSREDVYITNAVHCRPPQNRTPTAAEIRQCRYWIEYEIKRIRPRYILLLGNIALQSVMGVKGIRQLRGKPQEHNGAIVLPTYHPAATFRDERLLPIIERDFQKLAECIEFGGIPEERDLNYTIVDEFSKVEDMLNDLYGCVAGDLETTRLYPFTTILDKTVASGKATKEQLKEHRQTHNGKQPQVVSIQFATGRQQWVIPAEQPGIFTRKQLVDIVDRITEKLEDCYLVGQNWKFDSLWMRVRFGVIWHADFDCMLAHYLLDENDRHGLKELAQKFLGAPDWDVSKDTKTGWSLANAKYAAHDVYFTRKLRFFFRKWLDEDPQVKKVFEKLMMPYSRLFTEIEFDGVYVDQSKLQEAEEFLRGEVADAERDLQKWMYPKWAVNKKGQPIPINWGSPQQLARLLYEDLGLPGIERTKSGKSWSTSESVLLRTDHSIAGAILKRRGADKQLSAFIEGWQPFIDLNGYLHPSFKLHGTVTGRPSCLSGDTPIMIPGGWKPIQDIKIGDQVYSYDKDQRLTLGKVSWSGKTGNRPVYRMKWSRGGATGIVLITGDHLVRMVSGKYRRVDRLRVGDQVMALSRHDYNDRPKSYPELKIFGGTKRGQDEHRILGEIIFGENVEHVHHRDDNIKNNSLDNLEGLTRSDHMKIHQSHEEASRRAYLAHSRHGDKIVKATIVARKKWSEDFLPREKAIEAYLKYGNLQEAAKKLGVSRKTISHRLGPEYGYKPRNNHRIVSIELLPGNHEVYDITVDKHRNFIANEVCVHNCEHPNLQQVPRDKRIRQLISALKKSLMDEWVLLEVDLSQIELRLAAELANEHNILQAFREGADPHWITALREIERGAGYKEEIIETAYRSSQKKMRYTDAVEHVLGIGVKLADDLLPEFNWPERRKKAKAINFGYLFGMWWRKFKLYARDNYGVDVTDQEAQDSRKTFFNLYPGFTPWHNKQKRFARNHGYVRTLSGRKRRLPQAQQRRDTPERREAERQAINSPVQGFAAELNLMVALQIRKEFPRTIVKLCGTVHDSCLMRVRRTHVVQVCKRALEIMRHPDLLDEFEIDLSVPLDAEAKIGAWGVGVSLERWLKENELT